MFNELRSFNTSKSHWTLLSPDYSTPIATRGTTPPPRSAHSLCAYRDKVVLFGGSGAFIREIGLRMSFNDLWIWDTKCTDKNKGWKQIIDKGEMPRKRMQHAGACLGGIMLVMGGFSTEAKTVLDDFNLFDCQKENWLKVRMTKHSDGKIFTSSSLALTAKDPLLPRDPQLLYGRKLQKICGVWDL